MLGIIPPTPQTESPLREGDTTAFDWNARLSLEAVRSHSKTDDVPGVTDDQLTLYRQAAIEAAELYTGFLLSGIRNVVEPIEGPKTVRPGKHTYRYRLKYPVADGYVHLYGGPDRSTNRTFRVPLGTRKIEVPISIAPLDLSNCCLPCNSAGMNGGMMAAYRAGFRSIDDIPGGIFIGMLQFITWIVEHPGDELLTQRNRVESRSGAVYGSNNIALISGAIEAWRMYDSEAI